MKNDSLHITEIIKKVILVLFNGLLCLRRGRWTRHYHETCKRQPYFTGDYQTWEEAEQASSGYSSGNILEITRAAMLKIRDGEALYERDSVIFNKPEYPYPLLANLLRIALNTGHLSVLDFGGALGSTYFQCRRFLASVENMHWSVVEQAAHVECGKNEFSSEHLQFYNTVEECLGSHSPNTLILSSILQYLPTPFETLQHLLGYRIPYVLIDRTAFLVGERSRLAIQTVPETIYKASYPAWFFNENSFLEMIGKAGYHLFDDFAGFDHVSIDEGKTYYKGFVLELKS